MRPTRSGGLAVVGTALLVAAVALVVRSLLGGPSSTAAWQSVTVLAALGGLGAAAWQLRSRPAAEDDAEERVEVRRAGRYQLVETAPERTAIELPLAGHGAATLRSLAIERAGDEGVAAGVALVRPELRAVLEEVLVAGGATGAEAERAIDAGEWTADRVAAAVLCESVTPPSRSFRARLRAWLWPERAVSERIDRAAAAMATASDERVSAVPGRTAPRLAEVPPPTLPELRRDVDGSLREAIDGRHAGRGRPAADDAGAADGGADAVGEGPR